MYAGRYPGGSRVFGTFISEAFDVSIVGENAILRYACDERSVVPLRVFREMVGRSLVALAEHDAKPDNVVSMSCFECARYAH